MLGALPRTMGRKKSTIIWAPPSAQRRRWLHRPRSVSGIRIQTMTLGA